MQAHPRAPHVYFEIYPRRDHRVIHCQCTVCRDHFYWPCRGSEAMLAWRVENYVNLHLHGAGQSVYFQMPKG